MKRKLEDIEKRNIYKVPDGYFEELPSIIQAKVTAQHKKKSTFWSVPAVKYAIPVLMVIVMAGYYAFFKVEDQKLTASELLAQIETEALVEYLASSEITMDEIIENIEINEISLEFDQNETNLLNDSELQDLEFIMDELLEINEL